MSEQHIHLTVNGKKIELTVAAEMRLVDLLVGTIGISSCREDCGKGECGTCTVLMNDESIVSCLVLAIQADGADILTVEGLVENGEPDPILQNFRDRHLIQCGNCIPAMVLSARHLLQYSPSPDRVEIVDAIAGVHCRCSGPEPFVEAIETMVAEKNNN